jgi:hypothetical protein
MKPKEASRYAGSAKDHSILFFSFSCHAASRFTMASSSRRAGQLDQREDHSPTALGDLRYLRNPLPQTRNQGLLGTYPSRRREN